MILGFGVSHGAADPDRPRRAKSSVYNHPYGGPASWQWGKQLFWEQADTSGMQEGRRSADQLSMSGVSPLLSAVGWVGAVRWGDTTLDTTIAFQWRDPAWKAYTRWTYAHDSLTPIGPEGTYLAAFDNPLNSYWIPFTIPLDSADCPLGMTRCTYGDFAADRIGRLCARANLAGIYAADFVDGLPGAILTQLAFNPEIMKAFEDSTGIKLPAGSVSEKATAITNLYLPEWADFWSNAWGKFYGDIAAHVRKSGKVEPLNSAQTGWDVVFRRLMAVDFRRYLRYMPSRNWFFSIELQGDNMRAMKSLSTQINLFGTYTSWEPEMPIGVKINVVDPFLGESMRLAKMRVADSVAFQRSQYLLSGFTHIATRSGAVRRATQAFEYGYYDHQYQVEAKVTDFLLAHFPRRPHGPALFFSEQQIKSYERKRSTMPLIEQAEAIWNAAPYGYFVTDAALDSLRQGSAPSAWLVPSADRLTAEERARLLKHAPILSPDSAAKTSPIRASGNGKAWGFWDHESSLVVLVTNPDSVPLATRLTVSGLKPGRWNVSYLGIADSARLVEVAGEFAVSLAIAPYDTRAYLLSTSAPASVDRRPTGAQAAPAKGISRRINGIEVVDQDRNRIRDVQGRVRIPY